MTDYKTEKDLIKKHIKGLECVTDNAKTNALQVAYKHILVALEKQIPKEWIYLQEEGRYLCPSCNSEVAWYDSYCRDCGQKLKG